MSAVIISLEDGCRATTALGVDSAAVLAAAARVREHLESRGCTYQPEVIELAVVLVCTRAVQALLQRADVFDGPGLDVGAVAERALTDAEHGLLLPFVPRRQLGENGRPACAPGSATAALQRVLDTEEVGYER